MPTGVFFPKGPAPLTSSQPVHTPLTPRFFFFLVPFLSSWIVNNSVQEVVSPAPVFSPPPPPPPPPQSRFICRASLSHETSLYIFPIISLVFFFRESSFRACRCVLTRPSRPPFALTLFFLRGAMISGLFPRPSHSGLPGTPTLWDGFFFVLILFAFPHFSFSWGLGHKI